MVRDDGEPGDQVRHAIALFRERGADRNQKRDYDEYYVDWIFWLYLSTVELTNRVIDDQRAQAG